METERDASHVHVVRPGSDGKPDGDDDDKHRPAAMDRPVELWKYENMGNKKNLGRRRQLVARGLTLFFIKWTGPRSRGAPGNEAGGE